MFIVNPCILNFSNHSTPRSRRPPPDQTLLNLAQHRDLFAQADARQRQLDDEKEYTTNPLAKKQQRRSKNQNGEEPDEDDEDAEATLTPRAERFLEALLWTVTLASLHLTFDVLVQYQYGQFGDELKWGAILFRTIRAWAIFMLLFWVLHPHYSSPVLIKGLPTRYQTPLRQGIFFAMSV